MKVRNYWLVFPMLALMVACDIGRVEGFTAVNRTEHDLDFFQIYDTGKEGRLSQVAAGTTGLVAAPNCAKTVVARTEDGTELARHEGRICVGDTWVIEDP